MAVLSIANDLIPSFNSASYSGVRVTSSIGVGYSKPLNAGTVQLKAVWVVVPLYPPVTVLNSLIALLG